MTVGRWLVSTVVLAALLQGCGGSALKQDDPDGYAACQSLIDGLKAQANGDLPVSDYMAAGESAQRADTSAIRDSLNPIKGLEVIPVVDVDKLRAACEDAGVEIPDE